MRRVKGIHGPVRAALALTLVLGTAGLTQAAGPYPGQDPLPEDQMAVGPGATAFIYYSAPIIQVTGECQGTPFSLQNNVAAWPGGVPEAMQAKDLIGFTYGVPGVCMFHAPHNSIGKFIVSSVPKFFTDVPGSGPWDDYTFAAEVQLLWVIETPGNN
jgi:hypothetical protein